MKTNKLDESNFVLYAAKNYNNPQCFSMEEFQDDLKRFKYIKRLFNRYEETGDLKERLILNHIIVLTNVFGIQPVAKMLFFKLKGQYQYLKPFMVLLNTLPTKIDHVDDQAINTTEIMMDTKIVDLLRSI